MDHTSSVSLPRDQERFFGVYDRKGTCMAVGRSSAEAVEVARRRLDLSTGQEVMNAYRVVQIGRDAYEHMGGL